jgi:hypothetical protein
MAATVAIYLVTVRNMGLAADAGRECEKVYEHLVGDSGVRTYLGTVQVMEEVFQTVG